MKTSKAIYNNLKIDRISDAEISKFKALMAKLLFDIDEVCNENDIPYIVAYGTLLGAVRHKGYIPWDDDIDIHMLREDIPVFKKKFIEKYGDRYGFVESYKTALALDMIEIKGTKAYELEADNEKIVKGIKIDIFALEYAAQSEMKEKLRRNMKLILSRMNSLRMNLLYPSEGLMKSDDCRIKLYYMTRRLAGIPCSVFPRSFYEWMFKHCCVIKTPSEKVTSEVYSEEYETSYIRDRIRLEFEGHMVWGPKDYDGYLRTAYGDTYMQIPPEDQRESHSLVKIDFGNL